SSPFLPPPRSTLFPYTTLFRSEAQDVARLLLCVSRALGELDAAGLAATARQHLRLHDHGPAERRRRGTGLLRGHREPAFGDRNAHAAEELLALVLVQIHGAGLY